MKALVLYEKKDGATELRDIPRPSMKDGGLLLRVKGAGICAADIDFFHAKNTAPLRPPVILGHEFCGVVEEVGSGVKKWKPGDRVVSENTGYVCGQCFSCLTGKYLLCPERLGLGYSMNGGFAEYVYIPEQILQRMPDCLHRLPDSLSFEEGGIIEPSANAYKAVVQEGKIIAGESIAIYGPGPIGLFCVQIAKVAGASRIILLGREHSKERLECGKHLGADFIIHPDTQNVVEEVLKETGGEGVDVVIDTAGAEGVISNALKMIRPEGRIVRVSWNNRNYSILLDQLSNCSGALLGHYGYDYISWRNTLRLAERGMIQYRPIISKIFSLDKWREAFAVVEEKSVIKAVFSL